MRIGLFGGSFDPIHNAHLELARTALRDAALAQIVFVPAGNPWQRAPLKALAAHRLAMVHLAVADEPRYAVDACELNRDGPSYTVDTLADLARRRPGNQWMLLLGADQWARLPTWHRWQEIVAGAQIAVAQRAGAPIVTPPELAGITPLMLRMPQMATSSTYIRAQLSSGASVAGLVPAPVAQYIAKHQLYTASS